MTQANNPAARSTTTALDASLGRRPDDTMDVGAVAWSLGERVKELCCLYAVSEICDRATLSLDESMQGVVDTIPPSWQYPEICSARVIVGGREYRSSRFEASRYVQGQEIVANGVVAGTLEVFYSEERAVADEGPFLREERQLIDDIALRLGKLIEGRSVQRGLDEAEARRRALLAVTRETVVELDAEGVIHDYYVGDGVAAERVLAELVQTSVRELRGRYVPQQLIEEGMVRVRRVLSTGVPEAVEQLIGTNGSASCFEVRIARSSPARALVSIRDVTEQRAQQQMTAAIVGRTQTELATRIEECVCQELAGVADLAKGLARELPEVVERINELAARVDSVLARSRRMASCLSPIRLETDGLVPALSELAEHVRKNCDVACTLSHSGTVPRDYIVSLQLFRIAREAIESAVRHTRPRRVQIAVESQGGLTTLRTSSEGGGGFRGSREAASSSLNVMRVQAAAIGATLEVHGEDEGLEGATCRVSSGR